MDVTVLDPNQKKNSIAIIDLGSNSFHLMILSWPELILIHRNKQKVQLRAGLDKNKNLSAQAQVQALACLSEFSEVLTQFQICHIDIVGTYTLRAATGIEAFLKSAEQILNYPIRIISGEEEARLIYLGAYHRASFSDRCLIIDIGGGSTELIIGQGEKPLVLTSLEIGSVTLQQLFFQDQILTHEQFELGIEYVRTQVRVIKNKFLTLGWRRCMGSSGTVQAIFSVLISLIPGESEITLAYLLQIKNKLITLGKIDFIDFSQLRGDRKNILPGGLCVLLGLFLELDIFSMSLSRGALREGVLVELLKKINHQINHRP